MPDTKITALTAISTVDPAVDVLPIVDVSDTTMAASGTTKKITSNQILGAGGTATLASATITGDLTVASSILKVSGGNVGINTASPTNTAGYKTLEIVGTGVNTGGMIRMKSSDASVSSYDFVDNNGRGIFAVSNHNLRFGCNDIEQYRIQPLGIFTWYDGAGGTRMTLNSTGLGVGATPTSTYKFESNQTSASYGGWYLAGLFSSPTATMIRLRASTPNLVSGIGNDGDGSIRFFVNGSTTTVGSEAMVINASGNVGVGVTPSAWQSGYTVIDLKGGPSLFTNSLISAPTIGANYFINSSGQLTYKANGFASFYTQYNSAHTWGIAATGTAGNAVTFTTAMTLDASGNLLVGKTTSGVNTDGSQIFPGGACSFGHASGTASGTVYAAFGLAGVQIGSITQNGTTGVLYNINSDYRLKESVAPLSGGLARVNALKPSIYKWKSDGSAGEGFIAHELAEVVPFAVTGEKDAVNADGSIKSQGIDMSRIVPILVAAIKELTARVEALEA